MANKSITEVIYHSVLDMHQAGVVDATTMREFDEACLPIIEEMSPKDIQEMRLSMGISQAVLAKLINASTSTVSQWEIGHKKPRGISLKLLNMIRKKGIDILLV